jgi:glucosamine-6-phosphate deaminase
MQLIAVERAADTAEVIVEIVTERPPRRLGVATGSSPEPAFRALARLQALPLQTELYLVDEYVGLAPDSPASYRRTIEDQLAGPCGGLRVIGPDVDRADLTAAADEYEQRLRDVGGVDLQLLGIGRNGHVGFNEPGTPFSSRTRVAVLSETTRRDNARFFPSPDEVPTRCITQGLATIAMAREIVLIATGRAKAAAVAALLTRPPGPALPASSLLAHPRVVLVADAAARSLLDARRLRIDAAGPHRSLATFHTRSEQP